MRVNSPKQTKASRANGSKSKGPNSKAGKSKAAQNAIQDGVFARQVVIEQLGEKQAQFEQTKKLLWDFFQPSNTVVELTTTDRKELAQILGGTIQLYTRHLKIRREGIKLVEAMDAEARPALAVLDPSTADRFSRAETAVERRMYRALALLAAMRAQGPGNLHPEPKNSG
jgi:hypothetical protein